ncbi:serine/threonine protein kinase [Hyalangium gracile]|uniref:serine/threonine protein kinase n=1 Tax=Hyalangium gracile TaxID=394092 RepID=UPI001CCEFB52|nr:serine/threonine-protein kinase [Hyalangium gracile]
MSEDDKTYLSGQSPTASKPTGPLQIVPGTVLKGTYRIDAELGSGGMGTVYRATHLGLDKTMAVKVLSHRAIATPDSLARFEREAKVAGKVSHPAMTHVIDFGVEQGTPYIVMEYVSGVELAELIERGGPMSPRRAVAVMRQIVSLLRAAHALDIVHRDLKPANIKIIQESSEDSQVFVKVLDFGVAKVVGDVSGQLTSEGMLVGTPAYMAPEQITGKPIDGRTDLYSAGLIFHEMLSGIRAFKGETIARILHAQMNDPPPPLTVQVPDILRQTLQKFVEKRPEDRFQDAAEADRALMACEDVLRPPSVNVIASTVLTASAEQERAAEQGGKTVTYRPKQEEPAPVAPGPSDSAARESKPSSGVSVSDSLVKEGQAVREEPALVPAPVPAPVPVAPMPVSPPPPAPVAPALQKVEPRKSSGSNMVLVLVGVAVVLLLVGLAGSVWVWKSGLLTGGKTGASTPTTDSGAVAARPEPAQPPKNEPPPTAPEPNTPPEDTGTTAAEPGTEPEPEPPDTVAQGESGDEEPAQGEDGAAEGDEPPVAETPPEEELAPGCYVAVVAFESSRAGKGDYGPWIPKSLKSRTSIKCSSIPPQRNIGQSQGLFDQWPDSSGKPRFYNPITFEPQKKGEPNTRLMVVKVYTQVAGKAP